MQRLQREGVNESDESPDRSSAMQGEQQQEAEDDRESAPDGASAMKKSVGERDGIDNQSGLFDMDGPQSAQQDKQ